MPKTNNPFLHFTEQIITQKAAQIAGFEPSLLENLQIHLADIILAYLTVAGSVESGGNHASLIEFSSTTLKDFRSGYMQAYSSFGTNSTSIEEAWERFLLGIADLTNLEIMRGYLFAQRLVLPVNEYIKSRRISNMLAVCMLYLSPLYTNMGVDIFKILKDSEMNPVLDYLTSVIDERSLPKDVINQDAYQTTATLIKDLLVESEIDDPLKLFALALSDSIERKNTLLSNYQQSRQSLNPQVAKFTDEFVLGVTEWANTTKRYSQYELDDTVITSYVSKIKDLNLADQEKIEQMVTARLSISC